MPTVVPEHSDDPTLLPSQQAVPKPTQWDTLNPDTGWTEPAGEDEAPVTDEEPDPKSE